MKRVTKTAVLVGAAALTFGLGVSVYAGASTSRVNVVPTQSAQQYTDSGEVNPEDTPRPKPTHPPTPSPTVAGVANDGPSKGSGA
jgi:hypothetical protein